MASLDTTATIDPLRYTKGSTMNVTVSLKLPLASRIRLFLALLLIRAAAAIMNYRVKVDSMEARAVALADALDRAERKGVSEDIPEGVRTVEVSDTMARQIATVLRCAGAK